MPYGTDKAHRLKSSKRIQQILKNGRHDRSGAVRLVSMRSEANDVIIQAGFGVPKRRIRKAHMRNHIKRHMREAYRSCLKDHHDHLPLDGCHELFFMYQGGPQADIARLRGAMEKAIDKWLAHLAKV